MTDQAQGRQRLCHLDDLAEEPCQEFTITQNGEELSIFVVYQDVTLAVYQNKCPHLGIPLNMEPNRFLDIEERFISCSTHGALFQVEDGECISGPCLGEALTPITHEVIDQEVFITNTL